MSADVVIRQHATELTSVLPSHLAEKGDGWLNAAVAAVRKDRNLWNAANSDPGAVMNALAEAARLGLQPGSKEYYLTVRGGKVLGIVGYQGEIELMYRAGAVSSVIVEPVFERDGFEYTPGVDDRPKHRIDWDADDRGPIRLAYAYAVMKDGAVSKVVVVNKTRIRRAKDASATAGKSHSPWTSDEVAMWMKTAAHDLAKWVPTSAEYIREQLRAVKEVEAEPARASDPRPEPVHIVEAQILDEDPFPNAPEDGAA
ncbi:recombinase RecT [Antribacter gilvus]|uniref:recombinase RecT n=1 Tax=Antribacter gilvus TaxID=2304675 RepID=UPI000F766748|nr:recombinase RecT [Antribacter gilvus]